MVGTMCFEDIKNRTSKDQRVQNTTLETVRIKRIVFIRGTDFKYILYIIYIGRFTMNF